MKPQDFRGVQPVKNAVTRLGAGAGPGGQIVPGGLDLTTPSLALHPGALRDVQNFEVSIAGGYTRIGGYERVDGRPAPHEATYSIVQVSSFTTVPSVGDTASQASSGASGTIIAVNNVAGAYYIVLTDVVGAFDSSGVVYGSGSGSLTVTTPDTVTVTTPDVLTITLGTIGTATEQSASITALQNAQFLNLAADARRNRIQPVPGSGPILGVVGLAIGGEDKVFAFRANASGTAVEVYKTSALGWMNVPMLNIVGFTNGSVSEPLDGEYLIQGGVTALIGRVMTQSGGYNDSSAVGELVIYPPVGGSFAPGTATTTSGATLELTGPEAAITLTPGRRFQFDKGNFTGRAENKRIYGCDATNRAFEFDGQVLAPIRTGLDPDAPTHVKVHKNFLFLSQGSSVFHSGVGRPFKWLPVDGGGEFVAGDTVTDMVTLPGTQTSATLAVYQEGNTSFLYGLDPSDFNFVTFNTGTGAIAFSAQPLFETFVFDDLGVIRFRTSDTYGNFMPDTLTRNILPFIQQKRSLLTASSINREKSQYRTWFSDGYGLWITSINQQYLGPAVIKFPNAVNCTDDADLVGGGQASYFGATDSLGYIYRLDVGTSFDGAVIEAYMTLAWDALKAPRVLKRWRAASLEIQGESYAAITFGYMLGYGSTDIAQPNTRSFDVSLASGFTWDSGILWDSFVWDGQTLLPTNVSLQGTAENIQVTIRSGTDYIAPFTINSNVYHYTLRRGMRV